MKVLICDDHKIVREGLKQILRQMDEITFIGEAGDGSDVIRILKDEFFHLVILDISLPSMTGIDVLQIVKEKHPEIMVFMLSMHPQKQYAIKALKLGASGYLTKDAAAEELIDAVRIVINGSKFISPAFADVFVQNIENKQKTLGHEILSEREFEIMINLANGKSLAEIGKIYFISAKTVSTYRSRLMVKMGLNSNADLTKYCLENKLI